MFNYVKVSISVPINSVLTPRYFTGISLLLSTGIINIGNSSCEASWCISRVIVRIVSEHNRISSVPCFEISVTSCLLDNYGSSNEINHVSSIFYHRSIDFRL